MKCQHYVTDSPCYSIPVFDLPAHVQSFFGTSILCYLDTAAPIWTLFDTDMVWTLIRHQKMGVLYFWWRICVLSIFGWNLAKYLGLLPLAFTLAGMVFGIAFWDFCFQLIPFWVIACAFGFYFFIYDYFSLIYWSANAPVRVTA